MENTGDTELVRDIEDKKETGGLSLPLTILILIMASVIGIGTGYAASNLSSAGGKLAALKNKLPAGKKTYGVNDKKRFPDSVEGVLKEGGIEGEGNFHLERPGGKSQYVYLTSSIVDLSLLINRKVKVRGETFKAEKAGWLMDVGYVEILR